MMNKKLAAACAAVGAAAAVLVPASAAHAASTWCDPHSNEYAGVCFTVGTVAKHISVVEATPLVNDSSKTVTAHCTFSKTISKAYTVGGSVSEEAEAGIFGLVDAKTTVTISGSVTQTAAQASEVGGTVTLSPHQQITCERIYSAVVTTATEKEYRGTTNYTSTHSVSIPSSLGVRFVD